MFSSKPAFATPFLLPNNSTLSSTHDEYTPWNNGRCNINKQRTVIARRRRRYDNSTNRQAETETSAIFIWTPEHEDDINDMEDDGFYDHNDQYSNSRRSSRSNDDMNNIPSWWQTELKHSQWSSSLNSNGHNTTNTDLNEGASDILRALNRITYGPDDLEGIRRLTSYNIIDTFRTVVQNILGTLPADVYDNVITFDRLNLVRLLSSSLRTGYATRNAETKFNLNDSMTSSTLKSNNESYNNLDLNNVWGVISKSMNESSNINNNSNSGAQEMCARSYIKMLQKENELLRQKLNNSNKNKLVDFIGNLKIDEIESLHVEMSNDIDSVFKFCILRIVGNLESDQIQTSYSMRRDYVATLMLWCLHVGYRVRDIEQRMHMKRIFHNDTAQAPTTS